ncbi:MAG TPA: hypothetical protein VK543_07785 [Puia sp.]|nr:hypothetical protein [Puia sp.]
MKKVDIHLNDKNAKRVYAQFLALLRSKSTVLKTADRDELKTELISHVYESMGPSDSEENELNRLLNAIEKLGNLDDVVNPIIADKMIEYARSSVNPEALMNAYVNNSGSLFRKLIIGITFSLFFILVTVVAIISVVKIFDPTAGLYVGPKIFVLGKVGDSSQAKEILGYWIIPVAIILAFILYWVFLRLLHLIKIRR